MMLVGSLKQPCDRSIAIFVGAEPVLEIHAESSLCGRKPLFGGQPHQSKRGYRVLIVVPASASALVFVLLPKSELTERITQVGSRSAEPRCVQFTASEPSKAVFFDHRPQHERAWLAVVFRCVEQPLLPGDNIPICFSYSSRHITRTQMKSVGDGTRRVFGNSTSTDPL